MLKRIIAAFLAVLTLVSSMAMSTLAARTAWKPILEARNGDWRYPQENTETYKIKLGYFTTSKKVTVGSGITSGTYGNDNKATRKLVRFDVKVQYNGKNACYTRNYFGLKCGDTFYLTGKKWNEKKTYTITIKSYLTKYDNFSTLHGNYRLEY